MEGHSVAVLTPTLPERALLLREARASVAAQTVSVEHLVGVDRDREGPSVTRNRLAASRPDADWYLPLDDDDLLDADFVETLLPHLAGADVVYPWCRVEGKDDWTPNRLFTPELLLKANFIPVTALVRAELWREVGGMPEPPEGRVQPGEDWEFWRLCLGAGAVFRCLPEVLWTYRVQSDTRNWAAQAA